MGTLRESSLAYNELLAKSSNNLQKKMDKMLKESAEHQEYVADIKEHHEYCRDRSSNYKTRMLTECLSSSLKAVYISALNKAYPCMTESNYVLSENLVDHFIEEQGGARSLLRRMSGKTYFLETVRQIVEDTEEEVEATATDDEKDFNELPAENKDEMLDKLENEDDVDQAVDIIANRISSAEEEFIKKNAEDKEKIESIVNDINNRIQAVKDDPSKSDEVKEEIEQEAAIECKRKTNRVYEGRRHTIFEHMVSGVSASILKDPELKKDYLNEDGKFDMEKVVGTVKCMYGFLEFVNTTQLVKIDEEYIDNLLKEI